MDQFHQSINWLFDDINIISQLYQYTIQCILTHNKNSWFINNIKMKDLRPDQSINNVVNYNNKLYFDIRSYRDTRILLYCYDIDSKQILKTMFDSNIHEYCILHVNDNYIIYNVCIYGHGFDIWYIDINKLFDNTYAIFNKLDINHNFDGDTSAKFIAIHGYYIGFYNNKSYYLVINYKNVVTHIKCIEDNTESDVYDVNYILNHDGNICNNNNKICYKLDILSKKIIKFYEKIATAYKMLFNDDYIIIIAYDSLIMQYIYVYDRKTHKVVHNISMPLPKYCPKFIHCADESHGDYDDYNYFMNTSGAVCSIRPCATEIRCQLEEHFDIYKRGHDYINDHEYQHILYGNCRSYKKHLNEFFINECISLNNNIFTYHTKKTSNMITQHQLDLHTFKTSSCILFQSEECMTEIFIL